jgi:hypothetical protein
MSDYISNSNQSRILKQIVDQEDISFLWNANSAAHETPSFEKWCRKKVRLTQVHAPKWHWWSKVFSRGEFSWSQSVIFAMDIGHASFLPLTTKTPFTKTKQKNTLRFFGLQMQYLLRKSFVMSISFFMVITKKWKTIREELVGFLKNKTIELQPMDVMFIHSQIYLCSLLITRERADSNKLKPDSMH